MLRARILSAAILAPPMLLLIYLGGIPWVVGVLVIGVLAWREMAYILQHDHFTVDFSLGLFFVIGAVLEAYVRASGLLQVDLLRPLLAGLIVLSLIWALIITSEHPTADWGVTVASALYLGFLLGHCITLRERPSGLQWFLLALFLTWIDDTMAYFVGSALGKHKWWPRLSPKKTWEGLAGGCVAAIIAAPLLGGWLVGLNLWQGLLLGVAVAAVAPFGDLAISLFKRLARVKDTSQLIPGHGGILDRLDSVLFTVPVTTYLAMLVAGM